MDDIMRQLQRAKEEDARFDRILGSMCTRPHPVSVKAYEMFIESNLGDYELFRGSKKLEEKAMEWVAKLFHAPSGYAGIFTSGGTESNITALWIFKKLSGKREIVIPQHAHFSFEKASSILDMKMKIVEGKYSMRAGDVKKHIGKNTSCVVAVAGNTPFGRMDEIAEIAEICNDENIFLHVDAAFGGFVAPFISEKIFDFRAGISSICVDGHKMGMACIPSGFLLLRHREWLDEIKVRSRCTHTRFQAGMLGTRPGAAAAASYAVMHHLGYEGYRRVAENCMENTRHLVKLLDERGIDYVEPELNLVAIRVDDVDETVKKLASLGWFVGRDEESGIIRIVVMPHVTKEMINKFVEDLEKVIP